MAPRNFDDFNVESSHPPLMENFTKGSSPTSSQCKAYWLTDPYQITVDLNVGAVWMAREVILWNSVF